MRRVYKNLCPATINAPIMAANMWKNSLKNVESDNNKILYESLLDFLQRNGIYCLNKPRTKEELIVNLTKINSKRAPGEDGLTSDILIRTFQIFLCFSHKYTTRV